jgi:hypothetical protein
MENTRPTPVDLTKFSVGTAREDVLAQEGAPISTTAHGDGTSCDLYRLYTKGYGEGGKIPISVAETAADFFTLGLAEIVLTPTEAATKNDLHPVDFCYYKNQKLASVSERPESDGSDNPAPITAAQASGQASADAATPVAGASPQASSTQAASAPSPAAAATQAASTSSPAAAAPPAVSAASSSAPTPAATSAASAGTPPSQTASSAGIPTGAIAK